VEEMVSWGENGFNCAIDSDELSLPMKLTAATSMIRERPISGDDPKSGDIKMELGAFQPSETVS
jgi:hypothetical protein